MKNVFKKYLWLWEFIGVALIVGVGLVVYFIDEVLYVIVGTAFIILGLMRLIPLLKTTSDRLLKWIFTLEIILNVGCGITLIYLATLNKDLKLIFGYLIGGILYLRGFIYFFSTTIRKESTDFLKFITHIILITIGAIIVAKGGFTREALAIVILVLAVISAIFIGWSGYRNYRNYRNEIASKEITKKVNKQDILEAPTAEEIKTPHVGEENKNEQINA